MSNNSWGIAALIGGSLLLIILFGRKTMVRESLFAFSISHSLSWPLTILAAYWGRLESPVRLFAKATDSNFLFSFIFFPSVFIVYYVNYPRRQSRIGQLVFTVLVTGCLSLVHVAIQEYTHLLKYISFTGYRLWLISLVSFYLARIYMDWYFNQLAKKEADPPCY